MENSRNRSLQGNSWLAPQQFIQQTNTELQNAAATPEQDRRYRSGSPEQVPHRGSQYSRFPSDETSDATS